VLGDVVVEFGGVIAGEVVVAPGGVTLGEVEAAPGGFVVLGEVVELGEVVVEGVPTIAPPAGTQGRVAEALEVPLGELVLVLGEDGADDWLPVLLPAVEPGFAVLLEVVLVVLVVLVVEEPG